MNEGKKGNGEGKKSTEVDTGQVVGNGGGSLKSTQQKG